MKAPLIFLLTVLALSCSTANSDEPNPTVVLGASPPPFFMYVLVNKQTGEELVTEENITNLKVYYFKDSNKIYNQIPDDPRTILTNPSLAPLLQRFGSICPTIATERIYAGYLKDNRCPEITYKKGIQDFYLEWKGKTIGKMTLKNEVFTEDIKDIGPVNLLRFKELKFNDAAPAQIGADCTGNFGYYVLPVDV
jgi:hypothetical protein